MNGNQRLARRYHWLSEGLTSFVDEPHSAIEGRPVGDIVNLTDHRADPARAAQVELVHRGPDHVIAELTKLRSAEIAQRSFAFEGEETALADAPRLRLPARHDVRPRDVDLRKVHAALAAAHERGPIDFTELVSTPGLGARTLFSLALVAEVLHGAPSRFADPARFSLAHGGKDGHPFPVPLKVYDETIRVMKRAVASARIGRDDSLGALKRLDDAARRIDREATSITGPSLDEITRSERANRTAYGGRTVFDSAKKQVRR
jgi:hypothetical protein